MLCLVYPLGPVSNTSCSSTFAGSVEVCPAVIKKTTKISPATALDLVVVGEVSMGLANRKCVLGECLGHS